MKAHYQDNTRTVYNKSCHDMSELPDNSIHCVVTSPPYWGLRKYAGEQEIKWADGDVSAFGLEKNIELYVQHSIEILREIRRVLRPDGCCFWNIADSYDSGSNSRRVPSKSEKLGDGTQVSQDALSRHHTDGLKPKDLCLIPFRVALAAQADGWWVRSVIIWNKNNPMPESVKDRPTDAHEYILMLTKSARYFWDMEAVREPMAEGWENYAKSGLCKKTTQHKFTGASLASMTDAIMNPNGRNLRSVWTISTQPFSGAHFATFPEALPERCIKAATSEAGVCPKCGRQWERIVESKSNWQERKTLYGATGGAMDKGAQQQVGHGWSHDLDTETKTLGWRAACTCNAGPAIPATVLDPFCGSGTTLLVATRLGRKSIGYDISTDYMDLIIDRNRQQALVPAAYQKKLEE